MIPGSASPMEEIIRIKDEYYILATSPRVDDRTQVLKHGDTFAVLGLNGDIVPVGQGEQGLYHEGTRFLSRLQLRLGSDRPLLLSSAVREQSAVLVVNLTNPDVSTEDRVVLPRNTLHFFRVSFLWQGVFYQRVRVRNFALHEVRVAPTFLFASDFADIFEVRGVRRDRRGSFLPPETGPDEVVLGYEGLDGVRRRMRARFFPPPVDVAADRVRFESRIPPKGEESFTVVFACEIEPSRPLPIPYDTALHEISAEIGRLRLGDARVETAEGQFNDLLDRAMTDLHIMVTRTPQGLYPYAGIPWFSTVFGRDGIITALQYLWVKPELARGVLGFLASCQATQDLPEQDAEPGKIIHEIRRGEMAALGEIPFGRYYGSVDATPLFVLLAGAYYVATADLAFIRTIWPNVVAALEWIDRYGDRDGDGFVEYARRSAHGLTSQGWKDSHDSVFHEDGELAEGPIALCEVQGYVYAARRHAAVLAEALGEPERAEALRRKAEDLRRRFEETFWCEDLSMYALALDGRKRPCRVRTSNAGQVLFTGIAAPERARRIAEVLMDESFFSGWGIRTVAASEARYNPMSYHNGSVWPHDNALIARGFARYGIASKGIQRILMGLADASTYSHLHRLPELFCGFRRRSGEGPTLYPVACSPQAWSAGSIFMLLEACLGLSVDALRSEVRFVRPALPEILPSITIRNLRVGAASVDLHFHRRVRDVQVDVLSRRGDVEIVIVK